jgi:NADPH2:quinone reductase
MLREECHARTSLDYPREEKRASMKAIIIDEALADRPLRYVDVPEPIPGDNDLLIAVKAAALNRADLRRAATHFAASDKTARLPIAGVELAGEVVAIGAKVTGVAVGDRIMAMASGAYAEQATIDYRLAMKVPASMSWEQAAATPITFVTAHDALVSTAELKHGEDVFVQGASSGAGIASVQIARLKGARSVFGTAGTPEKLKGIQALGCDFPINHKRDDFVEVIRGKTSGRGADIVIDLVGSHTAQGNIDACALRARIVCVGRVAGLDATMNLDEFSRKRIRMIGVTFRTRSMDERIAAIAAFEDDILPALANGKVYPVVDSVFPLQEAAIAQERMRENKHFGKIILKI